MDFERCYSNFAPAARNGNRVGTVFPPVRYPRVSVANFGRLLHVGASGEVFAGGRMKKLLIVAALALGLGAIPSTAAILYPSIVAPLRSAIADEIDSLTNNPALSREETRQLRLLRQSSRNLDRRGRASLFGDVQILSGLATSLTRGFPGGEFNPLLQQAIFDYGDLLLQSAANLQTNISGLPPSSSANTASNAVNDAIQSLGQLDAETPVGTGIQVLNRAVSRLRSAEAISNRSRPPTTVSARMTATVAGRRFIATAGGVSANYSPGTETLTIVGRETGGLSAGSSSIQIILSDVTQGTTTHSLGAPGTGSYATFSTTTPTNSIGLTSLTGNVTVTLNTNSSLVSGRFSFETGDPFSGQDRVRVTGGDFAVPLRPF